MRSIPRKPISFSDVDQVLASLEFEEPHTHPVARDSHVILPMDLIRELNIYASKKGVPPHACLEKIVRSALKPQVVSRQGPGESEILHSLRCDLESLLCDLNSSQSFIESD